MAEYEIVIEPLPAPRNFGHPTLGIRVLLFGSEEVGSTTFLQYEYEMA